ncbi:polysaccharide biosynthesis tyrosine autokinase [Scytonema sp. UIC 10036]|uniref:GumC family protein n=1 Tax=Scytonema sp. UIC 10036 TaxID=2304196 RepID=UPI0012DAE3CB|nr:polysaccharide biosynthesis tyrosine autokinase [Scytonema sp. UIC 10036]MUG94062.1 polysaccharide biosynthesis tyrosine autokinase [Scytonema sp. UIC 10036]
MEDYLQIWFILRRRWLPASIVFLAVFLLSAVRTMQDTPIYQASGQLLFKKNTTSSLTGVGSQLGQLETSVRGNPLDNEAAILRSLPLAERAIAALRLSQHPQALLQELQVFNVKGTDILELSYTSTESKKAASIVNTLMRIYIENDISANRAETRSARDFIAQQLPIRKAALQAAEETLQKFKQRNRVLDLKAEAASSVAILSDLDRQVAATRSEFASQTARKQSIQSMFGVSSQEAVIAGFVGESPTTISVLGQLQEAQQKLEVSRLRLTDAHPTVINLREQVNILNKELKRRIQQSFIGKAGRFNQIKDPEKIVQLRTLGLQQGLLQTFAGAEAERLSLQVRLKALDRVIDSYRQRANTLPQLELQQRQIEREIAATETSYKNLLDRYQELQVAENQQVGNARIITPALVPGQPIKSRQYMNLLQGLMGGILLASAAAWLLEKIDGTVKTSKSARDLLSSYPVLAIVPPFPHRNLIHSVPEVIVRNNPDSPVSEAFQMLQTNLRFFNSDRPIKVTVVTSSVPKEGKSTVAVNLAVAMSQLGRRVLLIDGDLRHPSQHKIWEIPNERGLSSVLTSESYLEESVVEVQPNLQVLIAGVATRNPVALLDSSQMAVLVAQVAQTYDFVIIDTPPLTVAADATILGKISNGVLFVVRPGVADSGNIELSKDLLEKAGQHVLGVAINAAQSKTTTYGVSAARV